MRHPFFRLVALVLALVGYWSPWLTHATAALRLNGYELSEWITFLPGVRSGELPLSRLLFLLPLACLALLLSLIATRVPVRLAAPPLGAAARQPVGPPPRPRHGLAAALPAVTTPWAWALLLAGLACAFVLLPPYPYLLTALRDPEFQGQLFIGLATLLGLVIVAYLPAELKDGLQFLLGARWRPARAVRAVHPAARRLGPAQRRLAHRSRLVLHGRRLRRPRPRRPGPALRRAGIASGTLQSPKCSGGDAPPDTPLSHPLQHFAPSPCTRVYRCRQRQRRKSPPTGTW